MTLHAERGQSLTELALLLPLLVLILLGSLDLGRAFFAYVGVTNAAREGARYGIDNPGQNFFGSGCPQSPPNPMTIRFRVCEELQGSGIQIANPNTDILIECSALAPESYSAANCDTVSNGARIRVTVQYNFSFISTQVIGLNSIIMSNYATMAITNGAVPTPGP